MTVDDYRKLLNQHDWLYMFSDDHSAWKAGEASRQRIENLALLSRDHAEAYFSARNAAHSMKPEGQLGIRSN